MEEIKNIGKLYTQREDVAIENRVFFRCAIGVNATQEQFREATEEEYEEWQNWLKEQEDEEFGE